MSSYASNLSLESWTSPLTHELFYPQVRCMMAVLLLIGQKLEAPDIIDQLLEVEKNPRKPQYR